MTTTDLGKLLQFLGYGTLDAPIWFLGMEEAFSERPDFTFDNNLQLRSTFSEVMDIQDAHDQMKAQYWRGSRFNVSKVWYWMSKFTLTLIHGDDHGFDTDKVINYIRTTLGRDKAHGGETLLLDLLPLPKRSQGDWPSAYRTLFSTCRDYENDVRPKRMTAIKNLIDKHHPKYLFCYGQTNYGHYRQLVGDENWIENPLTNTKFWIKKSGETTVILSPFFGVGALATEDAKILIKYLNPR